MVLIDSFSEIGKSYYPQVLLEECKYFFKDKKVTKYINEDLEISSNSDESGEE